MDERTSTQTHGSTRHRDNARLLGGRDIVIAAYPGSGASLLGNIVLEMGFDHIDPYTDVLDRTGTAAADGRFMRYRSRLAATAKRDGKAASGAVETTGIRFFKNHLPSTEFEVGALYGAVLLVRDPRDSLYASYQYFRNFCGWMWGEREEVGRGTFEEFLEGAGVNGERPALDWTNFCGGWLEQSSSCQRFAVVRFEDLKREGPTVIAGLLKKLDLEISTDNITAAVERSSFQSMRAHEDQVCATEAEEEARRARLMRRGKVDEWREWFGEPGMAARFSEPALLAVAEEFGYSLTGVGAGR